MVPGLAFDDPGRPKCRNLLGIYQLVSGEGRSQEDVLEEVGHMKFGTFKPLLAEALVEYLVGSETTREV